MKSILDNSLKIKKASGTLEESLTREREPRTRTAYWLQFGKYIAL